MAARGTKTTLKLGSVTAPVALYKTSEDPRKPVEWDTAGPKGGRLKAEQRAKAVAEEAPPKGDPLAVAPVVDDTVEDPGSEAPPPDDPTAGVGSPAGEFERVLVEEGTGKVVEPDDVRRGIRREDDTFIDLTERIAEIDERTKLEEMEVVAFVDVGQVPRERVVGSYFLAGDEPGAPKVLRVLFEAMRKTRRVAAVKWTKSTKQALGVIAPHRSGALLVLQLSWAEDWREAPAKALGHLQASVTSSEVAAAVDLVQAMRDTRDAVDELSDDARRLTAELRAAAIDESIEWVLPERVEPKAGEDVAAGLRDSAEKIREAA